MIVFEQPVLEYKKSFRRELQLFERTVMRAWAGYMWWEDERKEGVGNNKEMESVLFNGRRLKQG